MATPMHAINSAPGAYGDDSDITIINPSMTDDDQRSSHHYVPILDRLKQATNSVENRNDDSAAISRTPPHRHEFIFVDHNHEENAQQLEQVLQNYIRDLKQENRPHLECSQQLVIRLMDLIRPVYSKDQKKMIELDGILREISFLHDKRHVEQKEKLDQLHAENIRLQKLLFDASQPSSLSLNNRTYSMPCPEADAENNDEHWTEIEGDAKKLQGIVQKQQEHIHEIVTLLNQQTIEEQPVSPSPAEPHDQTQDETLSPDDVFEEPSATIAAPESNSLLHRLKTFLAGSPATLVNRSPGTSPTHSLTTLTVDVVNRIPSPSPVEPKTPLGRESCPVCQQVFVYNDEQQRAAMYDHFQHCLFPPHERRSLQPLPTEYVCPECQKKYAGDDERNYLQHLADCFNRD